MNKLCTTMYAIRIIVLDGKDIQFIITKVGKPNSIPWGVAELNKS